MQENVEEKDLPSCKTEFFRMDKFGIYRLRILPATPDCKDSLNRKNYGYLFLDRALMYVLNMNSRSDGIRLLALSYSQFMDLEDRRLDLHRQLLKKNPYAACPVSSVYNAFPVEIEKRRSGERTEYLITIDGRGENDALSLEELRALAAMLPIPEIISRYREHIAEAQNPEEERRRGG